MLWSELWSDFQRSRRSRSPAGAEQPVEIALGHPLADVIRVASLIEEVRVDVAGDRRPGMPKSVG
jgi:hypothetical protein